MNTLLSTRQSVLINDVRVFLEWRQISEGMDLNLWSSLTDGDKEIYSLIRNENRKKEWSEGRRTLSQLPDDCLVTSLAHSDRWVVAAGVVTPVRGLGIDLENQSREISDRLARWIEHDERWTKNALDTWLVKEACFKADRAFNDELVLSDYAIVSTSKAQSKKGQPRAFSFQLYDNVAWRFAIALLD